VRTHGDARDGKQLYKNAFATDHWITDQTVEAIVQSGRTRWKVENENNNTLKTKATTWNQLRAWQRHLTTRNVQPPVAPVSYAAGITR